MPFTIVRNDITKMRVDAVVNAANTHLSAGSGVCGAIFEAAGYNELTVACRKIGGCETGKAVITPGFGLTAKYIIHTVGPVYGENPDTQEKLLYDCYMNSLLLARKKRIKSIAFPLISSGAYGYPKALAMNIASKAVSDFPGLCDMDIFLVVYDKDSFIISDRIFSEVRSFIDDNMVKPQTRRRDESMRFVLERHAANHEDEEHLCDGGTDSETPPHDALSSECTQTPTIFASNAPPCKDMAQGKKSGASRLGKSAPKHDETPCTYTEAVKYPGVKRSLDELIGNRAETFSQMLLRLIDTKGMTDVEVYKRANIDRKLFSKIRKKDYVPKKSTVIALIIALRLNMDEAADLLGRAGFAFSKCNKSDIIIEYFIRNGNYDIYEINSTLFSFDEQVLGA